MLSRSFFPNFGQGPLPDIAGKALSLVSRHSVEEGGSDQNADTKQSLHRFFVYQVLAFMVSLLLKKNHQALKCV